MNKFTEPPGVPLAVQWIEAYQEWKPSWISGPLTSTMPSCVSRKRNASSNYEPTALAALIQAHANALCAHPEDRTLHVVILSILLGLEHSEITLRQALRRLRVQTLWLDDPSAHQVLYARQSLPSSRCTRRGIPGIADAEILSVLANGEESVQALIIACPDTQRGASLLSIRQAAFKEQRQPGRSAVL
jgi:hypothetical protein